MSIYGYDPELAALLAGVEPGEETTAERVAAFALGALTLIILAALALT